MERKDFEQLVKAGLAAIPERFRKRLKNVAFLVEDEPSEEVRRREGLLGDETLLGYYAGIPLNQRGEFYGVGPTMPDTITIFQKPVEEEAEESCESVRKVAADTVWHEVAHYLGLDEEEVQRREKKRKEN